MKCECRVRLLSKLEYLETKSFVSLNQYQLSTTENNANYLCNESYCFSIICTRMHFTGAEFACIIPFYN